jgi:hypothetical protein
MQLAGNPEEKKNDQNRSFAVGDAILRCLRWTGSSYFLLSLFLVTVGLIITVWWPLAEDYFATADPNYPIWMQMDGLLLGIFLAMSILIMGGADLRTDVWLAGVALIGGLVIESWGTQTNLWFYYTAERPPLWIIPAWPIATLAIDRLRRMLSAVAVSVPSRVYLYTFWAIFGGFFLMMLFFARFTFDKPLTLAALLLCAVLMLTPGDKRTAVLVFIAGAGLGYFLELWGTTRACWTYYTHETPPLFAVLAHGMAAFAFVRAAEVLERRLVIRFPAWLPARWLAGAQLSSRGLIRDGTGE